MIQTREIRYGQRYATEALTVAETLSALERGERAIIAVRTYRLADELMVRWPTLPKSAVVVSNVTCGRFAS